jgi:hypothetical protein
MRKIGIAALIAPMTASGTSSRGRRGIGTRGSRSIDTMPAAPSVMRHATSVAGGISSTAILIQAKELPQIAPSSRNAAGSIQRWCSGMRARGVLHRAPGRALLRHLHAGRASVHAHHRPVNCSQGVRWQADELVPRDR